MEKAITKIKSYLKALPKRATIVIWLSLKDIFRGIKEKIGNLAESVIFVIAIQKYISIKLSKPLYVASTTGTLKNTDVSLQMKKVVQTLKYLNLDGLANKLGITKEGVTRLIWLLGDARNTNNGSEPYSSEMILLVKNALLKERILKQTTFLLDSQPSLMKKESQHTSKHWNVKDYGIQRMVAHSVVNAIVA